LERKVHVGKKRKSTVEREVMLLKKKLNSKVEVLKTLESKCVAAKKVELENINLHKNVNPLIKR